MIKDIIRSVVVTCALGVSINAVADQHTVSVGYAQTKVEDFKNLKGVNVQYHYENESQLDVAVSTSYLSGKETENYNFGKSKGEVRYFSALTGPSYRFNEYVSAHILAGFANIKASYNEHDYSGYYNYSESVTKTSFAYGAGVVINPVQDISVNVGYEGTNFKGYEGETAKLNGFNIGVGYSF